MAKVFLEGIQHLDFENKKGERINGYNLHISYPDEHVIGKYVDTKFISMEAWNNLGFSLDKLSPLVQHDVDLETNIKGKVIAVNAIQSK